MTPNLTFVPNLLLTPSGFTGRAVTSRCPTPHAYSSQTRACLPKDPPPPLSLRDTVDLWVENILMLYGNRPSRDQAPVAQGDLSAITGDSPFFLALHRAFEETGPLYKLCFGPKLFIVVQDPAIVRSILREKSILYDKGLLAEVLQDVMGNGLIPADYQTWKIRRRAIVPGFHKSWLKAMTGMFAERSQVLVDKLADIDGSQVVDMEIEYTSLTLDIIGKAIFNYDFESVKKESPIIRAVYRTLKETEHRSIVPFPYWKLPLAPRIVPRLRSFYADMSLINNTLKTLIQSAKKSATSTDLSDLEKRDYENVKDPSMLRFLVELRGEETTNKQLRDDLMTMLIAGHETTAAVLTWATAELAKNPQIVEKARKELDTVLDGNPKYEDVARLPYIRRIIAETLRLYPAPPLLIRRLLADTTLPKGSAASETHLKRGTDIFINVYSLHRSPDLWEDPERFDPDRWLRPFSNDGIAGWEGYNPAQNLESGNPLYPNELNADFAYLPFGGGSRKCVGDNFAILESVVALAMFIKEFDFVLEEPDKPVEMTTGATIHTKNGLNMRVRKRRRSSDEAGKELGAAVLTK